MLGQVNQEAHENQRQWNAGWEEDSGLPAQREPGPADDGQQHDPSLVGMLDRIQRSRS